MKKLNLLVLAAAAALVLTSCGKKNTASIQSISGDKVSATLNTDSMDLEFSNRDTEYDYDESDATVVSDSENEIKITAAGTYVISGKHKSVTVKADDSAKIRLILKNAEISNTEGPAIYIEQADKVFITAYKGTVNTVTDSAEYSADFSDTNVDAAIFSKADLTVNGEGTLNVGGNKKCGIVSKDDLIICGLNLNVTSVGCALEGKDCVKTKDSAVVVTSGGDGIKSTNSEDGSKGFVYVENGNINITSQNDGLQAATLAKIANGIIKITAGGGAPEKTVGGSGGGFNKSNAAASETEESTKGIKAEKLVLISGGEIDVNSYDDGIHSDSDVQIDGGEITVSAGDDGIHADSSAIINGGSVTVTKSYEGLEGKSVSITGGTVDITASDDGINAADGSSAASGRPGENGGADGVELNISGGYITVNASGDGVDSNGNITVSGGIILVSGSTDNGNGALDCDGTATITGGTVLFCGSSGMAETFSENSLQPSFMYTLDSAVNGGTAVSVTDSSGKVLVSFVPSKQFVNVVVSTPELKKGSGYTLNIGGTVSNCDKNGYSSSGGLSGASASYEVSLSSVSTVIGSAGGMNGAPEKGGALGGNAPAGDDQTGGKGFSGGGTPPQRPDNDNGGKQSRTQQNGNT